MSVKNDLDECLIEIHDTFALCESGTFPFFFIVGAGVSAPQIPTASEIIELCKKKVKNNISFSRWENEAKTMNESLLYSFWIEKAYPSQETRRLFFKNLVEQAKISDSNLQIANILMSKQFINLVVTPNFDNQIERSLNYLNYFSYVSSVNNDDNLTINLRSNETQIIHLHGSYTSYNIKNLQHEIKSIKSDVQLNSMQTVLEQIFKDRSPIVLGYSGTENDLIMDTIKKRLSLGVPYKYYWFCYDSNAYSKLPEWLKNDQNVVFYYPNKMDDEIYAELIRQGLYASTNIISDSKNVLLKIRESFKINSPELFDNPLMPARNLISNIDFNKSVYDLKCYEEELLKLEAKHFENLNKKNKLIKLFNENNINSFIFYVKKYLGTNSNFTNSDFDYICKNLIEKLIFNHSVSFEQKKKLLSFCFNIPSYRNTSITRRIAYFSLVCMLSAAKAYKKNEKFSYLMSFFHNYSDALLLNIIDSKYKFIKNCQDFEKDFNLLSNHYFKKATNLEYIIYLDLCPIFILLASMVACKNDQESIITDVFEKIVKIDSKKIYRNKKLKNIVSFVIPILSKVDNFESKIYEVIIQNFHIKKISNLK